MSVKKQFTVCLENKPGQLAKICSALKRAKVNILAISVADSSDNCLVRLVPANTARARGALSKLGLGVSSRDIVAVPLPNKPGALGEVSARLSKARINIDYAYGSVCGECEEAVCILAVSDARKASRLLKC